MEAKKRSLSGSAFYLRIFFFQSLIRPDHRFRHIHMDNKIFSSGSVSILIIPQSGNLPENQLEHSLSAPQIFYLRLPGAVFLQPGNKWRITYDPAFCLIAFQGSSRSLLKQRILNQNQNLFSNPMLLYDFQRVFCILSTVCGFFIQINVCRIRFINLTGNPGISASVKSSSSCVSHGYAGDSPTAFLRRPVE